MRLFITGATGFLGSHVLSAALAAGYEVRALRRHEMSSPVVPLTSQPVWCEGDLSTLQSHWFEGVDAVVHLAAAGVSPKQARWSELVQVNVVGSLQLLEMAKEIGVRRFVVAGTSHEYGNAARRYEAIPPDSPLEPVNAYGASKAAGFVSNGGYLFGRGRNKIRGEGDDNGYGASEMNNVHADPNPAGKDGCLIS